MKWKLIWMNTFPTIIPSFRNIMKNNQLDKFPFFRISHSFSLLNLINVPSTPFHSLIKFFLRCLKVLSLSLVRRIIASEVSIVQIGNVETSVTNEVIHHSNGILYSPFVDVSVQRDRRTILSFDT